MDARKTQAKHTPGPWSLWTGSGAYGEHGAITDDAHARHLAYIAGGAPETGANARLMAAAPDLLAALQEAQIATRELCEGQGHENECWAILNRISAAIAKATGAA